MSAGPWAGRSALAEHRATRGPRASPTAAKSWCSAGQLSLFVTSAATELCSDWGAELGGKDSPLPTGYGAVPVSVADATPPGDALAVATALATPDTVGAKLTVTVQLPAGASVPPKGHVVETS